MLILTLEHKEATQCKSSGLEIREVWILALPVASCVLVDGLLNYSEPQFLCPKNGDNYSNRKWAKNMDEQFIENKWLRGVENMFNLTARNNDD